MCGIVGYIGTKDAAPFLIEGLEALEYRGYDSAGLYVLGTGAIKRTGKVEILKKSLPPGFSGTAGIAHTRWATHGPPTEANAHPHTDQRNHIWLVHNGIIENYKELKESLVQEGIVFASDTDTEVLAQLIGREYRDNVSLPQAVARALALVRGAYGIAVASADDPDMLVAARLGSPLLIGIGEGEHFIASDATPLLPYTRRVVYLDDGEMAVLSADRYEITTLAHDAREKDIETLDWDVEAVQKKGYEHFMLKEIMEMPDVLANTMRGRLDLKNETVHLGGLADVEERLRRARRFIITGCGSAYYAGLIGELMLEELVGVPVECEIASEFRYRRFTGDPADTVLIAVSQSGETADTLEAVREAKRHGMLTLGIVNAVGSSIARETDAGVYNHAGPEIGVASTKAFVSQLTVFAMLAVFLKGKGPKAREIMEGLTRLPEQARIILEGRDRIKEVASAFSSARDALFIGRKFQYPIAFESALKLKEISYIHAEAYGAGEMKHGPLALIDGAFPTIAIAPKDSMHEKTRSNMEEIKARGGPVILVSDEDGDIPLPATHEALMPILSAIPLQLLAYYVAHARGLPIDKPRNLAKSVTVE